VARLAALSIAGVLIALGLVTVSVVPSAVAAAVAVGTVLTRWTRLSGRRGGRRERPWNGRSCHVLRVMRVRWARGVVAAVRRRRRRCSRVVARRGSRLGTVVRGWSGVAVVAGRLHAVACR